MSDSSEKDLAALAEAAGYSLTKKTEEKPAAEEPTAEKQPSQPEEPTFTLSQLKELKSALTDLTDEKSEEPPASYDSPGAPGNGPQSGGFFDFPTDARKWSRADVEAMQDRGEFMERLEKFRSTLEGGRKPFDGRRKVPKVR